MKSNEEIKMPLGYITHIVLSSKVIKQQVRVLFTYTCRLLEGSSSVAHFSMGTSHQMDGWMTESSTSQQNSLYIFIFIVTYGCFDFLPSSGGEKKNNILIENPATHVKLHGSFNVPDKGREQHRVLVKCSEDFS